jgi:hypothetical protein
LLGSSVDFVLVITATLRKSNDIMNRLLKLETKEKREKREEKRIKTGFVRRKRRKKVGKKKKTILTRKMRYSRRAC